LNNNVLGFLRWDDEGNVILTLINLSDNQWKQPIYGVNREDGGSLGGDL
jgi:hypothetical protein